MKENESDEGVQLFAAPWTPGQNTGVGSHSLLQGIFPTQGLNPGLLHCRQTLYYQAVDPCIYMSESLCCLPEIITISLIGYTPL